MTGAPQIVYGASELPEFDVTVVTVRHLTVSGIQGTYILKDVTGYADLYKRCGELMQSRPDLRYECHYAQTKKCAWLATYKK